MYYNETKRPLKIILRLFSSVLLLLLLFIFIKKKNLVGFINPRCDSYRHADNDRMQESQSSKYAYSDPISFYPFNKGVDVAKTFSKKS